MDADFPDVVVGFTNELPNQLDRKPDLSRRRVRWGVMRPALATRVPFESKVFQLSCMTVPLSMGMATPLNFQPTGSDIRVPQNVPRLTSQNPPSGRSTLRVLP
jgi:hypothetical protein